MRKLFIFSIAAFALVFAFISFDTASNFNQTIYNNFTNITNGSQINNGSIQINESQVNNLTTDLNSKVNKSGDNMTGNLNLTGNMLNNVNDIYAVDSSVSNNNQISSYQSWDASAISPSTVNFFSVGRRFNKSSYLWESLKYNNRSGSSMLLFNNEIIFTTFLPNSNSDVRRMEYVNLTNDMQFHSKVTVDDNIKISTAGKGITLYAPNGNPWCTTVNNAGTLNTAAGACT